MAVRTLPNDPFAEQSVIGSMFLSKYALSKACENLDSSSFFLNSQSVPIVYPFLLFYSVLQAVN